MDLSDSFALCKTVRPSVVGQNDNLFSFMINQKLDLN